MNGSYWKMISYISALENGLKLLGDAAVVANAFEEVGARSEPSCG